jgi:DNA-binding transcriptional regulator YiaG
MEKAIKESLEILNILNLLLSHEISKNEAMQKILLMNEVKNDDKTIAHYNYVKMLSPCDSHVDFDILRKRLTLEDNDFADLLKLNRSSIRVLLSPSKELPKWAKTMLATAEILDMQYVGVDLK